MENQNETATNEATGGHAGAEETTAAEEIRLPLVTQADFSAVDIEAPIATLQYVDCRSLADAYSKAAEAASADKNEIAQRVYRLLANVTWMHFKPGDRGEPYGPIFVMDGRRSIIPDDLRGEQSSIFAEIAPTLRNAGLRALLADISWLNDRSLTASGRLAIASFTEAVRLVANGNAEFRFDNGKATSRAGTGLLRRACQIAQATGWKEPEAGPLRALIAELTQASFNEGDASGFLSNGTLDLYYGITDTALIATQAESLAAVDGVFPDTARCLLELAAAAHRSGNSKSESDRCLKKAAECYVSMAAAADFKGMAAASWLMDAIRALRRLPGTKERRVELEAKLSEAQASISDEMGVISTEIDLGEIVDHTRKVIGGLTLPQALAKFARLERSPEPETLRKEALKQAEENPLSSIVPMAIHDDEGKLVAQSPGILGGPESEDVGLRHLIARHEGIRREITVSGAIEPARRLIQAEHPLCVRHFEPITAMSPFAPPGHADLYALGFARFFGGDFISALSILVPQLENSLRHVLRQAAIDPSSIQSDMTQESRTISVMLDKDGTALERIFGPAIVFEIENLFAFRGGPMIRHRVAHGLMPAGAFYSSDEIYACWFIFHLCCLPLFAHWDIVTEAYASL
ncbi:MAG: hypothetical protein ACFCUO_06080 [Rhodospirillales bacterium]